MPHSPKVAEALEKSIRHWRENLAAERPSQASARSDDCALCRMFSTPWNSHSCVGCPVGEKTGKKQCFDTPYHEARRCLVRWSVVTGSEEVRDSFRGACEREIAFLESLRESTDAAQS